MIKKINWDEVPEEEVNPKMRRRIVYGEKIMIAKMRFKDGFLVPLHSHENEQITEVLSGTIRFWFGENKEQQLDIHAGETVVIPGNLPHAALMIGDVEEIDTWAPPRQDWIDGTDDYLKK
ncbi:MAG: cupin domain-containing protein [Bacteroidia bacterium]|nr:cupin domain-containing protein [Bacteroidia bacterium]